MGTNFGTMLGRGGIIEDTYQDNITRAQGQAANTISMGERIRLMRREESARKAKAAGQQSTMTGIQPLEIPEGSVYTQGTGGYTGSSSGGMRVGGTAPQPYVRPNIKSTAPGGSSPMNATAPVTPTAASTRINASAGGGNMNNEGGFHPGLNPMNWLPSNGVISRGAPNQTNEFRTSGSGGDSGAGEQSILQGATTPGEVVRNGEMSTPPATEQALQQDLERNDPVQQQQTGAMRTAGTGAPPAYSGAVTKYLAKETAKTTRAVQQIDAKLAHMNERYQQLLPHAEEDYAVQELSQIWAQAELLSLQRDQVLLNDSFTNLANSGDPTRVMQVLNAMGYQQNMQRLGDGRIDILSPDGQPLFRGSPQAVASHLRVTFSNELQAKRIEHLYKMQEDKMKYDSAEKVAGINAKGNVLAQANRGLSAAQLVQQGKITKLEQTIDGNQLYVDGNGDYLMENIPLGGGPPVIQYVDKMPNIAMQREAMKGRTTQKMNISGNSQSGRFTRDTPVN